VTTVTRSVRDGIDNCQDTGTMPDVGTSGYRPSKVEPNGRWARHIDARRREWDWSLTRGFEEVHEALGYSDKSRTAYRALDLGEREPTTKEAEALASVYGWPPEGETAITEGSGAGLTSQPDLSVLVPIMERQAAAAERQADAIEALVRLLTMRGPAQQTENFRQVLEDAGLVTRVRRRQPPTADTGR
jgi:hypothetical protein